MDSSQDRFSRQILALGKEGQNRINGVKIGIVGLGGIGSFIVQMLAHLGVKDFILVDEDVVEESNLNRLIGATFQDSKDRVPKVDVAKRLILSISPDAKVKSISKDLKSQEAIKYLCEGPEVIFGCVDNDSARLILSELASAYKKDLIDSATEILVEDGRIIEFGGRVVVARPGDFCLLCANQIDVEVARKELESKDEQSYRKKHGYGLGELAPAPAVVSLNGTISSLAVTEFIALVTDVRKPNRKVNYRGIRRNSPGVFGESLDEKKKDCVICNWLVGKRDEVNLQRYLKKGLPADLPR
jgi:molybdopterin/thiamine biosynthesis adenylyltransferase